MLSGFKRSAVAGAIAACSICLAGAVPPVAGRSFDFRKVAETGMVMPGADVNFSWLASPSLDKGHVVFNGGGGEDDEGVAGFYTDLTGALTRVVDSTMEIPGNPSGTPLFLWHAAIDDSNIAFLTWGSMAPTKSGVYLYSGGDLSVIADSGMPMPDQAGALFTMFNFGGAPSIDNDQVVFVGESIDFDLTGVFSHFDGTLSTIADGNTPLPNGQDGTLGSWFINNPKVHNGTVAFFNGDGLFVHEAGVLKVLADRETPLPNDPQRTFTYFGSSFGSLDLNDTSIVFIAPEDGVYRYDRQTGEISTVAELGSAIPGKDGAMFENLGSATVSVSGDAIALSYAENFNVGESEYIPEVHLYQGGQLSKVLGVGDELDGKTVAGAWMGSSQGFRGNEIGMLVRFTDESEGIYVARVPEPRGAWLMLLSTGLLAWRSRSPRRTR